MNKIKEEFKATVKLLMDLCPAYNFITQIIRDGDEKFIGQISEAYPEIFDKNLFPAFIGMFGIEVGETFRVKNNEIGQLIIMNSVYYFIFLSEVYFVSRFLSQYLNFFH